MTPGNWDLPQGNAAQRTAGSLQPAGWGEPDLKTSKLEIELALITMTHGSNPKVIDVTIGHLQKAIEALRPVRSEARRQKNSRLRLLRPNDEPSESARTK